MPGQNKAWDAYFEVFTRDEISVFQFHLTKHADRLRAKLRDYLGILVCDAESRNRAGAPDVRMANCNAQPQRAFQKARGIATQACVRRTTVHPGAVRGGARGG